MPTADFLDDPPPRAGLAAAAEEAGDDAGAADPQPDPAGGSLGIGGLRLV